MADSPESMTQSVPSRIAFATSVDSARVGRRLPVIDSSICVAVMTGLPSRLAWRMRSFLNHGDLLDGYFHPEIPPGHHHAVGDIKDLFDAIKRAGALDFGDNKRVVLEPLGGLREPPRYPCRLDKGLAHSINPLFRGKFQALTVALGKGADAEIDARQIKPFAGPQLAANQDTAGNLFSLDRHTSSWIRPSLRKNVSPGFTACGSRVNDTDTLTASPIISSVVMVNVAPDMDQPVHP